MRRRNVRSAAVNPADTQDAIDQPDDQRRLRRELYARQPTGSTDADRSRSLLVLGLAVIGGLIVVVLLVRKLAESNVGLPPYFAVCSLEGRVYTSDPQLPSTECVVVEEGEVLYTGDLKDVRKIYGDSDTIGRLKTRKGRMLKVKLLKKGWSVIPGLIDSHAHPLGYGESKRSVDLVGSKSPEEVVQRIAGHIRSRPDLLDNPDRFVLGLGWDQTLFPSKTFPTARDLEANPLLVGRPIVLSRIDVHAYWVSSKVLEIVEGTLPDEVEGGTIFRDPTGAPTGIFLDNAMKFVFDKLPPWTDADRLQYLRTVAESMLSSGLTGVHDAAATPSDIAFYRSLDERGRLPVRISAMVDCAGEFCGDKVERYEGSRLSVQSVKIFADGALGSWGAAMWEPYSDNPSTTGLLLQAEAAFYPLISRWVSAGWQVNAHAIGDRANTVILDAFEKVIAEHPEWAGENRRRLRIEHAQILRVEDIERMGSLGIIGSVQPTHATADMEYAESRIGPQRIKGAYAWRTMVNHNVTLALGSDFPVSPVPPFLGLHAAIHRTSLSGSSPHGPSGWYPHEKLSPEEALVGFTRHAAFAAGEGWEAKVGSLQKGKRADLVVVKGDVVRADRGGLIKAAVAATVLDGNLVFGKL